MKFTLLKLIVIFCWTFSDVLCTYSKSRVYLDKDTGGYNDLTVVISSELKASDCPRILEDIKVFNIARQNLNRTIM